ncbi:MAG: hypothetical protein KJ556_12010 [Gammaproteobacteria bacterium]|nr:hypothetical protein [Gammaproteobacteria bacterium]MBU2059901.1 hypothetical protein [Gammaproteobacteria bacterium]MBU2175844.1 hypothetical protein [Gammaproteobacteria bacterium]MBU2247667.1 hypothetical protein [Gammaproteobacteria bacterium]MBU2346474.1 hypothetical protein [Gammaproteobacteria bacterium]
MMKIQHLITYVGLLGLLISSTVLQAAEPVRHMTLQQLCDSLPVQPTYQQFQDYEHCTKEQGPEQIAVLFADIYQKKQGKVTLAYLDGCKLLLQDFIADDAERYQNFSLWGCDHTKRYCVIFEARWEWWRYLLIDRKTKITTEFTGHLVFSPDSQLVFEYLDSRNSDTFDRTILKLYRLNDDKLTLLLERNETDFGVHSAKWVAPSTLEARLQHFAVNDFNRYVEVGMMRLAVSGDEVKVVIEKTTQIQ